MGIVVLACGRLLRGEDRTRRGVNVQVPERAAGRGNVGVDEELERQPRGRDRLREPGVQTSAGLRRRPAEVEIDVGTCDRDLELHLHRHPEVGAVAVHEAFGFPFAVGKGRDDLAVEPLALLEDLVDGQLEILLAETPQDVLQALLAGATGGHLRVEVAVDAARHPAVEHEELEQLLVQPAAPHDPRRRDSVALLVDGCRGHRLARLHRSDVNPVRLACGVAGELALEEHGCEKRNVVEMAAHLVGIVDEINVAL